MVEMETSPFLPLPEGLFYHHAALPLYLFGINGLSGKLPQAEYLRFRGKMLQPSQSI
jgi:hypothetical protein